MNNTIQTVTLVFDDGTEASFSGPAVLKEGKKIVDIYFSEPQKLPEDCSWGTVQTGENQNG